MESVSVIIGAAAVLVSIVVPVTIHRARHPKRRVSYFLGVTPQHPPPAPSHRPKKGQPDVPEGWPMFVRLYMWSSGRADVSTQNFDGDRPLVFRFSTPMSHVKPAEDDPPELGGLEFDDPHRIIFRPAPIAGDRVFSAEAIMPAPVEVTVRHPLIDVDVAQSRVPPHRGRTTEGSRHVLRSGYFWGSVLLGVGVAVGILTVSTATLIESWVTGVLGIVALLLIVGGLTALVVTGAVRIVRWALARRADQRRGAEGDELDADSW